MPPNSSKLSTEPNVGCVQKAPQHMLSQTSERWWACKVTLWKAVETLEIICTVENHSGRCDSAGDEAHCDYVFEQHGEGCSVMLPTNENKQYQVAWRFRGLKLLCDDTSWIGSEYTISEKMAIHCPLHWSGGQHCSERACSNKYPMLT